MTRAVFEINELKSHELSHGVRMPGLPPLPGREAGRPLRPAARVLVRIPASTPYPLFAAVRSERTGLDRFIRIFGNLIAPVAGGIRTRAFGHFELAGSSGARLRKAVRQAREDFGNPFDMRDAAFDERLQLHAGRPKEARLRLAADGVRDDLFELTWGNAPYDAQVHWRGEEARLTSFAIEGNDEAWAEEVGVRLVRVAEVLRR